MTYQEVKVALQRIQTILDSVRLQNSGADIHCIGNIRNVANLLKDQIGHDYDCLDKKLVDQILKNTEIKVAEFYKKKYFSSCSSEKSHREDK